MKENQHADKSKTAIGSLENHSGEGTRETQRRKSCGLSKMNKPKLVEVYEMFVWDEAI